MRTSPIKRVPMAPLSRNEPFETNPEDNLNVLRLVEDAYEYLQAGRRDSDV